MIWKFTSSFTDHSHTASVKSVAISSTGIAASGSSDESIKLFNLRKRVEIGTLLHHEGSVMGLQFFGKTHLFSYSEDGTIAVWKSGTWECLRTLRGHKGPVHSFAVHPSGKLALSCGKDKTLRTWNLMTARGAYITNVKQAVDMLAWSPDGSMYVMVTNNHIDVCAFETAAVIQQIHTDVRISCVTFSQHGLLLVGCEKGQVLMYDAKTFSNEQELDTGTIRVKAMTVVETDERLRLLVASSDGFIKLYDVCVNSGVSCKLIAEVSTGFRLLSIAATCLSSSSDKHDEDEQVAVADVDSSSAASDGEDTEESNVISDEREDSEEQHIVTVDTDYSAVDSHQTRKRTKKRASSQNVDSTTSVKSSNSGGHKQHSKVRKMQRKKFKKNSSQSAKDSVTVDAGLSKKKLEEKKAKHKRKRRS